MPSLTNLYFLHIPKTGGSSLKYWLADFFSVEDWMPCEILEDLVTIPTNELKKYRYFCGHFGLKLYNFLPYQPPTITWLRDPLLREISDYSYKKEQYQYLTRLAQDYNPAWAKYYEMVNSMSLTELCQSDIFIGYSDNLQVRYLSGAFPSEGRIECDQAMLESAKKNILNFFYFGVCEWMKASIDLLCYYLNSPPKGLGLMYNSGKVNAKKKLEHFSDNDLEVVRNANYYDIQLYEFAKEVFKDRFKNIYTFSPDKSPDSYFKKYSSSKDKTQAEKYLLQNFQSQCKQLVKRDSNEYCFSDPIFLSGWYPRVYDKTSGKCLRWAGPEPISSVYVPLEANKTFQIYFEIPFYRDIEIINSLFLIINGHKIILQKHFEKSLVSEENLVPCYVSGTIQDNVISLEENYTEIIFVVNRTLLFEIFVDDSQNSPTNKQYTSFAVEKINITSS